MNTPSHENRLPVIYLWLPIWLALAALGWVMHEKYASTEPDMVTDRVLQPKVLDSANQYITLLQSDRQGHYLFSGYINDQPVTFLLDTGATSVAIPEHLADYLRLSKGQRYLTSTANGRATAYMTLLKQVRVGSIEQTDVEGAILPGMKSNEILLGMSFLKNLEITQKNGEVKLALQKAPN